MNSNIRILILEDHPLQATALSIMFKNMGYEVVGVAHSGEKAIKLFRETLPDLVTLDIEGVGSIDGIEAGKAMMEIKRTPHIYVSANLEKGDNYGQAIGTTPDAMFDKPYNDRDVCRAVELAIRHHAINSQPASEPSSNVIFPNLIISRNILWIKQHAEARERFFKLPAQDILMVKSDNVYLEFHFSGKTLPIVIVMKISEFAEAIQGRDCYSHLLRVGQSYIVNLYEVASFTRNFDEIVMRDGTAIRISETYRDIVRKALQSFDPSEGRPTGC